MDSEFRQFLDTLKRLGIKFSINWRPTREIWQKIIKTAGYNVTALGCTIVKVGDTEYLFCNGPICWTGGIGYGPSGLFMLSRGKTTKEVQKRALFISDGDWAPLEGWRAAVARYPDLYWGPFKERTHKGK